MSYDLRLWNAVVANDIKLVDELCACSNSDPFFLSDGNQNILHLALKKDLKILYMIASKFPHLALKHNHLGSTPLMNATSKMIEFCNDKLFIMTSQQEVKDIALGLVVRSGLEQYNELFDSINMRNIRSISYELPPEFGDKSSEEASILPVEMQVIGA